MRPPSCGGPAAPISPWPLTLGADVPFCVVGGRAAVGGIGEVVVPLPYEERQFVPLLPPFGVDTAAVYRAWDELRSSVGAASGQVGTGPAEPIDGDERSRRRRAAWSSPAWPGGRDPSRRSAGPQPLLAGSGSTWYRRGDAG